MEYFHKAIRRIVVDFDAGILSLPEFHAALDEIQHELNAMEGLIRGRLEEEVKQRAFDEYVARQTAD